MRKHLSVFLASFLCLVSVASGDMFQVTVDTSSIAGTAGSLDFNFNPGPLMTQAASLQILNYASGGTLAGGPVLTGAVAGTLPSTRLFFERHGLQRLLSRIHLRQNDFIRFEPQRSRPEYAGRGIDFRYYVRLQHVFRPGRNHPRADDRYD